MSQQLDLFTSIGNGLDAAQLSQLFGKPCFKINGKAFVCFFEGAMVFKLTGEAHDSASALEEAKLFDPSGKGRHMKEWVQVPYKHNELWKGYAIKALEYVAASIK